MQGLVPENVATLAIDWNDEVFASACVTHDGAIRHEPTRKLLESA